MSTAWLPLYTPTASMNTITKSSISSSTSSSTAPKPVLELKRNTSIRSRRRRISTTSMSCRASSSSSSSSSSVSITEFDLYDLLGIESSSDHSQIKTAYRSLQKRCHPDIAGPAGHDMAIILNEAYALLSDPSSRLAYDKEQAKMAELRGFTGKPIYSVWVGSESEQRAVFVDEVKCIGCLKCALFADKTFAIESVYGRARVVAQWADPEHKIQEAIETCPVDCISIVERSNLAALEFLMSKQPRGNVRVGMENAAGTRVSNIFTDVKKFQIRFQDAVQKASTQHSNETDLQRASRLSAIQAIRSISNWLYWQTPKSDGSTTGTLQKLKQITAKSYKPSMDKLRNAAAARKQARESSRTIHQTPPKNYIYHEDYWVPSTNLLPPSTDKNSYSRTVSEPSSPSSSTKEWKVNNERDHTRSKNNQRNPLGLIPLGMAMVAAVIVHSQGEGTAGGLNEHMGGSIALQIVNSSWLPSILAGMTWCMIGIIVVGFVEAIISRKV